MFWMCIRIASVRRFLYTSETYDFIEKYRNFSLFIILIPTPDFPHFYFNMLGGNLGSLLYGDVFVMLIFQNLFIFTTADVVSCSGRKKSPRISLLCKLYFLVLWDHSIHFKLFDNRILL